MKCGCVLSANQTHRTPQDCLMAATAQKRVDGEPWKEPLFVDSHLCRTCGLPVDDGPGACPGGHPQ